MLILLLCAAIAVMALWPDTPAGRVLRRWLVEAPARRLRPGVLIFGAVLLVVVTAALAFGGSDGFVVAAQAPEAIGWFVTFDIGTYIDVLLVAWLLGASVRIAPTLEGLGSGLARIAEAFVGRIAARARAPRQARRVRRRAPPPTDDGRGWAGWSLA
jgi:hypothetical protein